MDRARSVSILVPAAGALALETWALGRPALWLDETASTVASERTWPHLWLMLNGTDAPLVPYYAVLKCARTASLWVAPELAGQVPLLVRWPSAAAMVLAVALLAGWLQRVASSAVAAASTAVLLLMVGISRYGQEARPYAIVLCLALATTVLWWWAVVERRRAWLPLYGLAVAALVALHVMAALLVPVQLVAAVLLGAPRARRLVLTLIGSVPGLLLASPLTVQAIRHGQGAGRFTRLNPHDLAAALISLVGSGPERYGVAAAILILAGVGAVHWTSPQSGRLVRLAVAWAGVPPVLFAAAVTLRPNLLIPRYLLFTLPAWAILAGVGLVGLAQLAFRPAPAAAVVVATIVTLAVVQWPALGAVRGPGGHGEDIVPSLVAADSAAYRRLPIYVGPAIDAIQLQADDPGDGARLVNAIPQADLAPVWPVRVSSPDLHADLRRSSELIVLVRRGKGLPESVVHQGYRVIASLAHGRDWVTLLAACEPSTLGRWTCRPAGGS